MDRMTIFGSNPEVLTGEILWQDAQVARDDATRLLGDDVATLELDRPTVTGQLREINDILSEDSAFDIRHRLGNDVLELLEARRDQLIPVIKLRIIESTFYEAVKYAVDLEAKTGIKLPNSPEVNPLEVPTLPAEDSTEQATSPEAEKRQEIIKGLEGQIQISYEAYEQKLNLIPERVRPEKLSIEQVHAKVTEQFAEWNVVPEGQEKSAFDDMAEHLEDIKGKGGALILDLFPDIREDPKTIIDIARNQKTDYTWRGGVERCIKQEPSNHYGAEGVNIAVFATVRDEKNLGGSIDSQQISRKKLHPNNIIPSIAQGMLSKVSLTKLGYRLTFENTYNRYTDLEPFMGFVLSSCVHRYGNSDLDRSAAAEDGTSRRWWGKSLTLAP